MILVGWSYLAKHFHLSIAVGSPPADLRDVVALTAFYLMLSATIWWLAHRERLAQDLLASVVPRRAAHSVRTTLRSIVGGEYVFAAALTCLGGIGAGVGMALFAQAWADRIFGLAFALGALVLVGWRQDW